MHVDQNDFFRQATLKICGKLDLGEALQDLIVFLDGFMPVDSINFNLFERELTLLKTVYWVSKQDIINNPFYSRISENGAKYIETRPMPHVRIINKPEEDPVSREQVVIDSASEKGGLVGQDFSSIVMYLGTDAIKIGNISVVTYKRNQYSEQHAELIGLLSEPLMVALSNALRFNEVVRLKNLLAEDVKYLQQDLKQQRGNEIIGGDFGLKDVMSLVNEVAPLDSVVLLTGETGVGKDLIANAIHTLSKRRKGPLIRVNCGAIPDTLMDSELFGHEKGSFTGASGKKRGFFERAHKGTIFLDEISEMSAAAQTRMLRVLQEKEIIRVGGTEYVPVDIRVIAATNKDLNDLVKAGLFRSDLWFRLHVFPIYIPALRDRREDIPALVYHFIESKSAMLKLPTIPKLARGALERLRSYEWPGNVRELENVVERALILSRGKPITFSEIEFRNHSNNPPPDNREQEDFEVLDSVIYHHIKKALALSNGKVNGTSGAAELLGIKPNTLRHRMKKLGIEFGRDARLKDTTSFP